MPSASIKPDNLVASEGTDPITVMHQLAEKKIRNLEKRKVSFIS